MELKLKDEITKMLIENPKMSVSEIAKKTNNYYSYTHKLLKKMEKENRVIIKKTKRGNKTLTTCELNPSYKNDWINHLKKIIKAVTKDAEIKASIVIMYLLLLMQINQTPRTFALESATLAGAEDAIVPQLVPEINYTNIALILIPVLIIIWYLRKRKK